MNEQSEPPTAEDQEDFLHWIESGMGVGHLGGSSLLPTDAPPQPAARSSSRLSDKVAESICTLCAGSRHAHSPQTDMPRTPQACNIYRDKVQQNYYKHQDEAAIADRNECIAIMDELMLRQPVWLQLSLQSRVVLSGAVGHSRELATLRRTRRQ